MSILPSQIEQAFEKYKYLGDLDIVGVIIPFALLLVILLACHLSSRYKVKSRVFIYALSGYIGLQVLLFNNAIAWVAYAKLLSSEHVGFRQSNMITYEVRSYFKKKPKYLAFGSSQTGAVYSNISKSNPDLYKIELAGLGPVEYFLYRETVSAFQPEYILLYLSDFDFGRKPQYSTFRYAPWQGLELVQYKKLFELTNAPEVDEGIRELILGNLFSEYKYSFIFKGFIKKYIGRHELNADSKSREIALEDVQLESLKLNLSSDYLELNMSALDMFLEYCKDNNVDVIIAEGQYHPGAYSEENIKLSALVRNKLVKATMQKPWVSYIPRERLPILDKSDYLDAYHVTPAAGERISSYILDYANSISKKKLSRQ